MFYCIVQSSRKSRHLELKERAKLLLLKARQENESELQKQASLEKQGSQEKPGSRQGSVEKQGSVERKGSTKVRQGSRKSSRQQSPVEGEDKTVDDVSEHIHNSCKMVATELMKILISQLFNFYVSLKKKVS